MRTEQGGDAGAKIQHPLTSAYVRWQTGTFVRHRTYFFFAAKARAQGQGTFPQSVPTRDRQGNVGIRVVKRPSASEVRGGRGTRPECAECPSW
jgi:hypothetical protein